MAFAEDNAFSDTYHSKTDLHQLTFVVETQLARQGKASAADRIERPPGFDVSDLLGQEPHDPSVRPDGEGETTGKPERVEYMVAHPAAAQARRSDGQEG